MSKEARVTELRAASGQVVYSNPLTSFLYELIRDVLPAGTVEKLVQNSICAEETLFTNGWLAHYANNLAETLRNAQVIGLKDALTHAFEEKKKPEDVCKEKTIFTEISKLKKDGGNTEEFTNEELCELENKVVAACGTDNKSNEILLNNFAETQAMIEELKKAGHISDEIADKLNKDLKEIEADEIKTGLEESFTDGSGVGVPRELSEDEIFTNFSFEDAQKLFAKMKTNGVVYESEAQNILLGDDSKADCVTKTGCCGKCKCEKVQVGMIDSFGNIEDIKTASNAESFSVGEIVQVDNKWKNTQSVLDDIDNDLEKLKTKGPAVIKETVVVKRTEPVVVTQEEGADIQQMLSGMEKVLNSEEK